MSFISAETQFLLALSRLRGVGPATLKKITLIPDFTCQKIEELAKNIPQIDRAIQSNSDAWLIAKEEAEKQIDQAEKYNARIISPIDLEYPSLLAATKDDPFILYIQGSFFTAPERSVAIIGTREPTTHGYMIAERITQFFANQNWSIVSGLAIGCDAIAHKAALNAGAHTVAVLAHGLHTIAPARNKKLAEEILASGGALISEYPFGQNVQNQQYVKRDRTQAGMSQGVVMIQSDLKGGSLHASRATLDYGRWLAVPYPTEKDRKVGEPKVQANLLIADGLDAEKVDLMRCNRDDLKRVIILKSREDYLKMIGSVSDETSDSLLKNFLENQPTNEFAASKKEEPIFSTDEFDLFTNSDPLAAEHQNIKNESTSEKRSFNLKIIVSANDLHQDKIERLSTNVLTILKKHKNSIGNNQTADTLASRLQYIQLRLLEIQKIASHYTDSEKDSFFLAQFSIGDMLSHMKKTIEELSSISAYSEIGDLITKDQHKPIQNTSEFCSFNNLINFNNYHVVFKNNFNSSIDNNEFSKKLQPNENLELMDLIDSFNRLIHKVNADTPDQDRANHQ